MCSVQEVVMEGRKGWTKGIGDRRGALYLFAAAIFWGSGSRPFLQLYVLSPSLPSSFPFFGLERESGNWSLDPFFSFLSKLLFLSRNDRETLQAVLQGLENTRHAESIIYYYIVCKSHPSPSFDFSEQLRAAVITVLLFKQSRKGRRDGRGERSRKVHRLTLPRTPRVPTQWSLCPLKQSDSPAPRATHTQHSGRRGNNRAPR